MEFEVKVLDITHTICTATLLRKVSNECKEIDYSIESGSGVH